MSNIYIQQDGEIVGPFTKEDLRHQIYSGALTRTVSARIGDAAEWQPLESVLNGGARAGVSGLLPVLSVPPVSPEQLRDPSERAALICLYVASVPIWLFIIMLTIGLYGLPLLVVGLVWLIGAFGEMWFMAYLKTNAVRVSPEQLPELHKVVRSSCVHLNMPHPDVYILQHNVWNAFAAKFFGRRVVVLFSGAVDSILLKGDEAQLAWLVGHELGHHWAGHLDFSQKLARLGCVIPWLGLWHSRRAELTCDRVGLYCAGSLQAAQLAMLNATVGAQLANRVNAGQAIAQWRQHRGEFFVGYRTLYSTHPHLLARLDHMTDAAKEFCMAR